jgi:hypothetical protein
VGCISQPHTLVRPRTIVLFRYPPQGVRHIGQIHSVGRVADCDVVRNNCDATRLDWTRPLTLFPFRARAPHLCSLRPSQSSKHLQLHERSRETWLQKEKGCKQGGWCPSGADSGLNIPLLEFQNHFKQRTLFDHFLVIRQPTPALTLANPDDPRDDEPESQANVEETSTAFSLGASELPEPSSVEHPDVVVHIASSPPSFSQSPTDVNIGALAQHLHSLL